MPHASHSLLGPTTTGSMLSNELREIPWEETIHSEDIRYLQLWYDKFLEVACNVFENDQLVVELSDIQLSTKLSAKGVTKQPKFDKLRPSIEDDAPSGLSALAVQVIVRGD